MKMKSFILPALALALFAACSGEEALTSENKVQQTTQNDAVTFDAYLNRTVTRAGYAGSIALPQLQSTGFGVFGYYSDGELYSENAIPDFMYNQQVTYSGSAWTYSPLKYWPNEFGSSAVSTGVDRVTFFAYAPYVSVDPSTGQLTGHYTNATGSPELSTETGITALTRNGKTGDPYVRYVGAFNPASCVDLLYGVAAEGFSSSVGATDGANNITAGSPFINVAKPEIGARLKFDFKHSLAKLAVKVDADVDIVNHSNGETLDNNTRIWIRSITFDGIADRGYLNLNNGMWYEVMCGNKISHASVTVYDGRRDGAEPIAADDYETPIGINTNLVQSEAYTTTTKTVNGLDLYNGITTPDATKGVTAQLQNLFGSDANGDLLVIPANEQLKVTIVYDVETADATLPNYLSDGKTKGSTVENRITKAITLGGTALKLDAGKAYTLNLHLGLTSVKFDAKVTEWDQNNSADNPWLPVNGPSIKAGTTNYPYSVPAAGGEHKFRITDLTAGSTRTPGEVSDDDDIVTVGSPFANEDNVSGILTATVEENMSVNKKEATIKLDESGTGSTTTTIKITQAAHPLEMSVDAVGDDKTIILKAGTGVLNAWDAITDATATYDTDKNRIQIKKNGTALTGKTGTGDPAEAGKFTFDKSNGKITLNEAPAVGDVYTITVKAGDADVETVTFTIGGIAFAPDTYNVEYGTTGFAPTPIHYGGELDAYSGADSDDDDVADVASDDDPTITIKKVGTTTISMKNTLTSPKAGYFFTNDSQTASYTLNVTKAAGTITYANDTKDNQPTTANGTVGTYTAVLKNSRGNTLEAEAAKGGSVSYSIVSIKKEDADAPGAFVLDSDNLKVGSSELASGSTYTVVLRATVTGNDNAGYAVNTADATITITTPNPGP